MSIIPYANSIFEQPWWLDIVAPGQWFESIVKDGAGQIVARMPYVVQRNAVIMPPLTQTLGIWMATDKEKSYSEQKNIMQEIFACFKDKKAVTQSLSVNNQYVLPLRWLGYRIEPFFTYRINNLDDCERIYQTFSKTAKKNIKAAQKKVSISNETNIDTLIKMLDKTFKGQNRRNPMPRDIIERIVRECDVSGHGKYLEAYDKDGNIHSCAYFVYDEKVCYYLLGASDYAFRSSGAQSLILWEGIQFAAKHSAVFDFEGSMVEGIEHFFKQFGGACVPYYTISKRSIIQDILYSLKPRIKHILKYKI